MYFDRYLSCAGIKIQIILANLYKLKINYRDYCDIISRIGPYYKAPLFSHKYNKLEKVRELFQVSRRQNHIAQQVTLCL